MPLLSGWISARLSQSVADVSPTFPPKVQWKLVNVRQQFAELSPKVLLSDLKLLLMSLTEIKRNLTDIHQNLSEKFKPIILRNKL